MNRAVEEIGLSGKIQVVSSHRRIKKFASFFPSVLKLQSLASRHQCES